MTKCYRQPHPLVSAHFKDVGAVANRSNRKHYECIYCNNPAKIENRDDSCLKHLSNANQCPNAPEDIRKAATQAIQGKKQPVSTNGASELILEDLHPEDAVTLNDTNSDNDGQQALGVVKKRKGSSIQGWADVALTPKQQNRADVKLFR